MIPPYDVENPIPADEWLALEEDERIERIEEGHRVRNSPTGGNPSAHATIHALVETRLALGDPHAVRAHDRFRAAGLTRHTTVHALASVVTQHMLASLERNDPPDDAEVERDFDALDPAAFTPKKKDSPR